jgi:hypothetical protein
MAGTCGPGSLHFINGLYEARRNRAPVILLATQIPTAELGFDFIQEVDFLSVFRDSAVFCDMIHTPDIEGVADDAVAIPDARGLQGVDDDLGDFLAHGALSWVGRAGHNADGSAVWLGCAFRRRARVTSCKLL